MRVLARAYGDQPLDRVAVGQSEKVIYIAAESVANAMERGEPGGVGFPRNCIFEFDQDMLESLRTAYESGDTAALAALWMSALPVKIVELEAA